MKKTRDGEKAAGRPQEAAVAENVQRGAEGAAEGVAGQAQGQDEAPELDLREPAEHIEIELARLLGVRRETFRALRKDGRVTRDVDWSAEDGLVCYRKSGVMRAVSALGFRMDEQALKELEEKTSWPHRLDGCEQVAVTQLCTNPRIVVGAMLRTGETVRVRIRPGTHLRVGQELFARTTDTTGLLECVEVA